jgi:hypothetical protein
MAWDPNPPGVFWANEEPAKKNLPAALNNKLPPVPIQALESAKKQAIASGKVDTIKPVVVQAVVTNSMQCKKIVLLVIMPGHIHDLSQIRVEFLDRMAVLY